MATTRMSGHKPAEGPMALPRWRLPPALALFGPVLTALLILGAGSAHGAIYTMFDRQAQLIASEVSYREDLGDATPFEKVAAQQQGWTSQASRRFEGRRGRLWARFDLPAVPATRQALILTEPWDSIEYFVVRDGKLVKRERTGVAVPRSERGTALMVSNFLSAGAVAVEMRPGVVTTVYARISTHNRHVVIETLRFTLLDEAQVRREEGADRLLQGIFLGALLVLGVYNFALYLMEGRDRSYLYYIASLAASALGWLGFSGLGFEVLWPGHPAWDRIALLIAAALGPYAFAEFARRYLDTRNRLPEVDPQLRIMAWAFLLTPPLMLLLAYPFDAEWARDVDRLFTLGSFWQPAALGIFIVFVCMRALADGLPSARLFIAATACAAAGSFLNMVPEISQSMGWLIHANQAGVVATGILLSLGMGWRTRQLRGELAHREAEKARLQRFLSPKVSELIAAGQMDDPLATRRREVTVVFVDLRGFTAFSEVAAPEDAMRVLREYHGEVGRLVSKYEGTIEHFAGDGVMMTFNDPDPLPDPALSAVRMAVELRDAAAALARSWKQLGFDLGCGLGVAQGYATIATVGFSGRQDYAVIGAVTNLAARLCTKAAAGEVLVSQRVYSCVADKVEARPAGEMDLKGFREPGSAYSIVAMKEPAPQPSMAV